jgi:hypothetical protein
MTREHVFPQWLVRRVRGAGIVASSPVGADAPPRIARLTTTVCAPCNSGWMSTLEVSFRSAFFARPRTGALQARDRITLSRWFTKTATLLADAHHATLVDAGQRAELMRGMPDGIEVFLGRRRRPPQRLDYALQLIADTNSGTFGARSVAVLIDEVVAHVAPRGALATRHGTRLWPLRTHALRWETLPLVKSATIAER